ncbi:serine aminopeptidase domain-containing protein [Thalassotalea mangrovi]|uniref:serine aminopeptidase domain-containing protein n=1 Tax=Thalassotalea mangrovi TaxID=2572245 RepID=UPI00145D518B|nr:alpha/beta hydrolase [Thalassotalea mangrovi]
MTLENGVKLQVSLYTPDNPTASVMVSGGNAASLSEVIYYHRYLLNQNLQVTFFSFQGFDKSSGQASLSTMFSDAEQVLARQQREYPDIPHFYVTHSISTSIGLCLSRHAALRGVVLESAMDINNIADYHANKSSLSWLLTPVARLMTISIPDSLADCTLNSHNQKARAMFIHHPNDVLTPYVQAVDIFDAYQGEKVFIEARVSLPPQYHQSIWYDSELQSQILRFISQ